MPHIFSIPFYFFLSFSWKNRFIVLITIAINLLFIVQTHAQFITINLEIPSRTEILNTSAFNFELVPDKSTHYKTLVANEVLNISSCENVYISATISSSGVMENENGDKLWMKASFAYRNDGENKLPGIETKDKAVFPISDSGQIVEFMKANPIMIYSFLYLRISTEMPKKKDTNYSGMFLLTLEYN